MSQSTQQEEFMQENMIEDEGQEMSELSEIIDKSDLEDEEKQRIIACIRREEFKGPLPHPNILRQYEEIQPGFAEKIIQMALNEQDYRHRINNMVVESETSLNSGRLEIIRTSIKLKTRLQLFGFFITTLLVVIGAGCIFFNKNTTSIVPFILAVASFCWTMFYGKKQDSREDSENTE